MADSKKNPDAGSAESQYDQPLTSTISRAESGTVLKLDLDSVPARDPKSLEKQIADLEAGLQGMAIRQVEADRQLQQLHDQSGKLQGHLDTHLDLTSRKLQAVLEKYTALKADADNLSEQSVRLEEVLGSTRTETRSLIQTLDEDMQQRIAQADQNTRELLKQEAQQAQQRHVELLTRLQAAESRLGAVEAKSTQLAENLETRARVLQDTIAVTETRLQEQIRLIEQEAKQRDEALRKETVQLRDAGAAQARRAQQHEARTGHLERQAALLDERAAVLSEQQAALAGRADSLESTTAAQADQLTGLGTALRSQWRGFSGALVLLILAGGFAAFHFHHQGRDLSAQNQQQDAHSAQLAEQIQAQQSVFQQGLSDQQSALDQQVAGLSAADNRMQQDIAANQREIEQQRQALEALDRRVSELRDSADSANGRLAALHPLGNYGSDSVIHSVDWLGFQADSGYMVRITRSASKQQLYKVADRWAYYLDGQYLAFAENTLNGQSVYDLYYGPFADEKSAQTLVRRMPAPDRNYPLGVVSLNDLLAK